MTTEKQCWWVKKHGESDSYAPWYDTACGEEVDVGNWLFGWTHCPYCGGRIIEHEKEG